MVVQFVASLNGQSASSGTAGIVGCACIAFGDVDNDGDVDMFASCGGPALLWTNGGGVFAASSPPLPVEVWSTCSGAAIGDLTNDGRADIWLTSTPGSVSQLLVNVGTAFVLAVHWNAAGAAVLHDVNGDGALDVPSADYINPVAPPM